MLRKLAVIAAVSALLATPLAQAAGMPHVRETKGMAGSADMHFVSQ